MKFVQCMNRINSMDDKEILARTLWGEARGECKVYDRPVLEITDSRIQGLLAVGNVIHNRFLQKTWYGSTIRQVCLKPYQFSCWNEHDPNLESLLTVDFTRRVFRICLFVAEAVIRNEAPDMTSGADHYHATSMKNFPSWVHYAKQTVKIGGHIFYKMCPHHF